MTSFLAEIGKKIAERWVVALVLPGLVFIGTAAAARLLGHGHALDLARLHKQITAQATEPIAHSPGMILVLVGALFLAAAAAGFGATALGGVIQLGWFMPGRRPPARWVRTWREKRWRTAQGKVTQAIASAGITTPAGDLGEAVRQRDRICRVRPRHPSWIGDRLHAADLRVHQAYDLDLASAWPRLWLIMPDTARSDIGIAHQAGIDAARLGGWAMLYLVVAAWWWPALPIAAAIAITAQVRARSAAVTLADLTEATVDVYGAKLATELGISHSGHLTRQAGSEITTRLRKDHLALDPLPRPIPLAQRHPTGTTNGGDT